jgi:hypothetical protein
MKTIYKILIWILILVLIWEYYYFVEKKAIEIDKYNFQQLEKAKQVVENFEKSWKKLALPVRTLDDFNYWKWTNFSVWMWADIEPLDKRYCYYVYYNKIPTGPWYIFNFWFKLHSLLYKIKYWWSHYNYPYKMEKPEPSKECLEELKLPWFRWAPSCGWSRRYIHFIKVINNPCER